MTETMEAKLALLEFIRGARELWLRRGVGVLEKQGAALVKVLEEAFAREQDARMDALVAERDALAGLLRRMLEYPCDDKADGCGLCEVEDEARAALAGETEGG